ncbi:MAG: site-2 protease family protein [Nitrososphaerota archaeon]|nr:site-2 protease family protein [Nitrososphaerota archaeon]
MDRIGKSRAVSRFSWIMLYILPLAAAAGVLLFASELGVLLLTSRGVEAATSVRAVGPLANLAIPGLNPYLPLVYGWLALVVGLVTHEAAHGIVARSLGVPVKSAGLIMFLCIPIGAFVEVDEVAMKAARPAASLRILAAGVGDNLVIGMLSLLALVGVVSTMTPVVGNANYALLSATASRYSSALWHNPLLYLCIPTLSLCQPMTPYSAALAGSYTSPLGGMLVPLANLFYWLFFLNFSLAIFNALPIPIFDGGQAFKIWVRAVAGSRLNDKGLSIVTRLVNIAVISLILAVILVPYAM